MLLLLLILFYFLCIYRVDVKKIGYHEDYLSKNKTDSIKGIFIIIVLLKHAMGYLNGLGYEYEALGDNYFVWLTCSLAQLIVVMFLFYSGYGVGESFKKKGDDYVRSLPRHRILTTLLNFDVAVLVFIIMGAMLGNPVSPQQGFLSLTGWVSAGNSNWYIFVILLCYVMTWVVIRMAMNHAWQRSVMLFAMCLVCLLLLSVYKESFWYDTILTYPMGFLFSTYKESIERFIKKHYWTTLGVLTVLFLVQFVGYYFGYYTDKFSLTFNFYSITFALWVVVLTMKLGIDNKPLQWFGKNLFPIYIYMRIPMILLVEWQPGFVLMQPAMFIVISLISTSLIAYFYHYWQIKLK
jgi:membrane-bound acyltransferase YfiQ involved in biofilm formation